MTMLLCCKTITKVEYSGEDLSGKASVITDKETKSASLEITIGGNWELYTGTSVETINFSNPILTGNGNGNFPIDVNDSIRSYFFLKTNIGTAILAERHLPMTGGYNFRDLGGFKTKEGKYVKWEKYSDRMICIS